MQIIALGIVAIAGESALQSTRLQLVGDGALLLASFSWSAYGLLARRIGLAPSHSASIVAVLSMCAYSPFLLIILPRVRLFSSAWQELLLQALIQGLLIGVVSIFVYSKALAALGASRAAILTAAVLCVTSLGAIALLHEHPSLPALAGIVLVTSGMILAMKRRAGSA